MYSIKYLGRQTPLNELIDIEGLTYSEILEKVNKFYTKSSKKITRERTEYYQRHLKAKPKNIDIVKVRGRWGSCSSEKNITYNFMISALPMDLIDYIVVHEICHLFHMNHDRSFWRKVGSILPDYKKRQGELHSIGGEE